MIGIKGMEMQRDCRKCPLMATDGVDLLSPMMCLALWATKHEVRHCVEGKILGDCPLVEIVTAKRHGTWFGTVCSYCGESTSFYYNCKYCPNCGAKMEEGESK